MMRLRKKILFLFATALMLSAVPIYANLPLLRVGTTGDYPPLTSYNDKTNRYSGFDIDMAKSLAKYLNAKLIFVKTTWPMLSDDLANNRFDIAMGGISDTKDRHEKFLISTPVLQDGKVPLTRCANVGRYASLEEINRPNVRVVENRGGTNLRFAQRYLKKAKLQITKDNPSTIDYLLKNRADVMITDRIEAVYRQKTIPELCVVKLQTLYMKSSKVYMVNKFNSQMINDINHWLSMIKRNGEMNQLINSWRLKLSKTFV